MSHKLIGGFRAMVGRAAALPGELHRDERGVMSLVSVFAVLFLVMLMGMVMNTARQIDGKMRLQNAADDAAYAGGVMLAREMNTLAFMNNFLSETFAMTAIMREGRDAHADKYINGIMDAWKKVGESLSKSSYPKFQACGMALLQKIQPEKDMASSFSAWAKASSESFLPLYEQILQEQLIQTYQQAVIGSFPDMAQEAAAEAARQDGQPDYGRGKMIAAIWRTSGQTIGGGNETSSPSLPVQPPQNDMAAAKKMRDSLARYRYLVLWNNRLMRFFDDYANLSQFNTLWRTFTCGQLNALLSEYPETNLPYVLDPQARQQPDQYVRDRLTYVGVAYWNQLSDIGAQFYGQPLLKNPAQTTAIAYAAVQVFIPRPRLHWLQHTSSGTTDWYVGRGPSARVPPWPTGNRNWDWWADAADDRWTHPWNTTWNGIDNSKSAWDLFTQSWTCKLVPATDQNLGTSLATILSSPPTTPQATGNEKMPSLAGVDVTSVNTH